MKTICANLNTFNEDERDVENAINLHTKASIVAVASHPQLNFRDVFNWWGVADVDYTVMSYGFIPHDSLEPLYAAIGEADIITTVPIGGNRPFYRKAISRAYVALMNHFSGASLRYYNATAIFKTEDLGSIHIEAECVGAFSEAIVKLIRKGRTVKEIELPVTRNRTTPRKSSSLRISVVWDTLKLIFRLWRQNARDFDALFSVDGHTENKPCRCRQ